MSYLSAVIDETLRIYPPAPGTFARCTGPEGDVIDGQFVPANISVGVHQFSTYHTSKHFANPEAFVPERWLPDAPEEYRHNVKAVWQPFSMGPRNCIGKNLTYFELHSILAHMVWNSNIELCEDSQDWAQQHFYLLWDKPPLNVQLSRRPMVSA